MLKILLATFLLAQSPQAPPFRGNAVLVGVIFDANRRVVGTFQTDKLVITPDGHVIFRNIDTNEAIQVNKGLGVALQAACPHKTTDAKF